MADQGKSDLRSDRSTGASSRGNRHSTRCSYPFGYVYHVTDCVKNVTFFHFFAKSRNEVFVHEPFLVHAPNDGFHLVDRVEIAEVMPADELPDVAVKVLLADLVERPLVRPLERRPEGFDPIRIRHAVDVLPDAVPNGFEVVDVFQAGIRFVVVRVEGSAKQHVVQYEIMQRLGFRVGNDLGFDLAGGPIPCADNNRLAYAAAPCMEFLVGVLVGFLAADVRLVYLNRPGEHCFITEELPHPLNQEPCAFLRHAQLAVNLHAGHSLEARYRHVDHDSPLTECDMTGLHDRPFAYGKILAASLAPVRHRLVPRCFRVVRRSAFRASRADRPADGFDPQAGRFLIGKHVHDLEDRHSCAVGASRCFVCHFLSGWSEYLGINILLIIHNVKREMQKIESFFELYYGDS